MNSPQEPVSPSPSTPSSGSPPPDEGVIDQSSSVNPIIPLSFQQLASPSLTKRRLASGPSAHSRDLKTRKRDDGGNRRGINIAQGVESNRDGGRREDLVDVDLMERLKQGTHISLFAPSTTQYVGVILIFATRDFLDAEFGDPFDESTLKDLSQ
ncbi:hypothetical protein EW145_g2397 [Phellinidium pouzarii]|uniref:Uncharacterized protein n=1 Tax=Phellinidium pouzarii TaxID=167371 RepID=A0A4S4LGF9_9AGAM|nr:hypothetical protein EW145_g2397 [Phellinidium pouzarii]